MQKVSWLLQPMNTLIGQHLQTLKDCPPVQVGTSFDLSKLAADVFEKRSGAVPAFLCPMHLMHLMQRPWIVLDQSAKLLCGFSFKPICAAISWTLESEDDYPASPAHWAMSKEKPITILQNT